MSKTIHRIIELISELNLSARQFDISIGTANGYILRMKKNNASVGSDVIERIKETYPQVNLVWLITGEGDMFINKESNNLRVSQFELKNYLKNKKVTEWSEEKRKLFNEIIKEIEENS